MLRYVSMTMADYQLSEIYDGIHLFVPFPDRIAGWRRAANVVLY